MLPEAGRPPDDFATAPEVPHMPWEDPELGLLPRLWATLGSTFHPVRDVARVGHGSPAAALRFALCTMLPVAFAAGTIPFTQLFLFGSSGALTLKAGSDDVALVTDVLRAGGLGVGLTAVAWLFSAYSFVTLARSFADPGLTPVEPVRAAWSVALYRAWLLPAGAGMYFVMGWLGPEINETRLYLLELAFHVLPGVIMMLNYSGVARYLGASSLAGLGAAFVPVLIFQFTTAALNLGLIELGMIELPQPPPDTP